MFEDGIIIKGNRDGLNVVINMEKFKDFDEMLETLISRMSKGKKFYKGSTLKLTTDTNYINEREMIRLKQTLFDEFMVQDCILEDSEEKTNKVFSGIYEGRTKFIRKTVRSGQIVKYSGNIVIIGDVNSGSEVYAGGNIIVIGALKGHAYAGFSGNSKAVVAAFILQPEILQIADVITRAPEDSIKPRYPEVARVKGETIVVEPYLPNKYFDGGN